MRPCSLVAPLNSHMGMLCALSGFPSCRRCRLRLLNCLKGVSVKRSSKSHTIPASLGLLDPEGNPAALPAPAAGRHLVVQLVRYFGCLPCQEWLIGLDQLSADLDELGADAAAVGGSADYQAAWLRDERGVTMPLYLDPQHVFRHAVEMEKPLGWRMANPRGAAAYVRSLRHGYAPQKVTKDTVRSPGVVIIDSEHRVVWRYEGTRIGDYPEHSVVLDAVRVLQEAR